MRLGHPEARVERRPGGQEQALAPGRQQGAKGPHHAAHGIAPRLTGETSVFVQVAASDALCYEATLGTVKKADGAQFKAKAP
jgi:hypothetical protein